MKSLMQYKKGQVSQLPGFFQIMMLVVIFIGLTFIVLEKFWSTVDAGTTAKFAIGNVTTDLYDYGVGFIGIVILVVMVYLIISIVSGRRGAK